MSAQKQADADAYTAAALADARARRVRLIHVGKRELGLDDDAYRVLLADVTGQASTTGLSVDSLEAVLARMKEMGFRVIPKRYGGGLRAAPRAENSYRLRAPEPQVRKLYALWQALAESEHPDSVRDGSEAALCAWVKRQTRNSCERPEWLVGQQATRLIEALKAWAKRCGVADE